MLKPLHNRILVERIDPESKTASGIIIPDTAKEKPQEGKVIAVGPGARDKAGHLIPMEVKKGDRILFAKFGGSEVTLDGKEYLIMKEDDVMGVVGS
ncbi:MAG TPA: co-chaperone GroES [bacterium]|nr:co-chaperone GroES [bacterium]